MSVCAWVTTALVVLQNKQSLVVVSDERSSPLRAVDQVVCPRGTGLAFELAGKSKLGGHPVLNQLGQTAEVGAPPVPLPPVPLPPVQPARWKAVSVGPLLSCLVFSVKVRHSWQHNIRDGDGPGYF